MMSYFNESIMVLIYIETLIKIIVIMQLYK